MPRGIPIDVSVWLTIECNIKQHKRKYFLTKPYVLIYIVNRGDVDSRGDIDMV